MVMVVMVMRLVMVALLLLCQQGVAQENGGHGFSPDTVRGQTTRLCSQAACSSSRCRARPAARHPRRSCPLTPPRGRR